MNGKTDRIEVVWDPWCILKCARGLTWKTLLESCISTLRVPVNNTRTLLCEFFNIWKILSILVSNGTENRPTQSQVQKANTFLILHVARICQDTPTRGGQPHFMYLSWKEDYSAGRATSNQRWRCHPSRRNTEPSQKQDKKVFGFEQYWNITASRTQIQQYYKVIIWDQFISLKDQVFTGIHNILAYNITGYVKLRIKTLSFSSTVQLW